MELVNSEKKEIQQKIDVRCTTKKEEILKQELCCTLMCGWMKDILLRQLGLLIILSKKAETLIYVRTAESYNNYCFSRCQFKPKPAACTSHYMTI